MKEEEYRSTDAGLVLLDSKKIIRLMFIVGFLFRIDGILQFINIAIVFPLPFFGGPAIIFICRVMKPCQQ